MENAKPLNDFLITVRGQVETRRLEAQRRADSLIKQTEKVQKQIGSLDKVLAGSTIEEKVSAVVTAARNLGFNLSTLDKDSRWGFNSRLKAGDIDRVFLAELTVTDSGNVIFSASERWDSDYEFSYDQAKKRYINRKCPIARVSYFKSLKITNNMMAYLVKRTPKVKR